MTFDTLTTSLKRIYSQSSCSKRSVWMHCLSWRTPRHSSFWHQSSTSSVAWYQGHSSRWQPWRTCSPARMSALLRPCCLDCRGRSYPLGFGRTFCQAPQESRRIPGYWLRCYPVHSHCLKLEGCGPLNFRRFRWGDSRGRWLDYCQWRSYCCYYFAFRIDVFVR